MWSRSVPAPRAGSEQRLHRLRDEAARRCRGRIRATSSSARPSRASQWCWARRSPTTACAAYLTRGLHLLPLLLIALLVVPVLVAVVQRPQRGVLLVAALIPFHGLLAIAPGKPPFAEGWKEALTLLTVAATFRPALARPEKRPWPKVWQAGALYFLVGLVSAIVVGGTQGAVGLKIDFFWFLIAIAVWRCPLDGRDRDRLVSILIVDGVLTALYGLWQQAAGAGTLFNLGYTFDENIRFTGRFVRSFSSFPTPFNFAYFLTLVILVALPVCLEDPRRPRSVAFFAVLPLLLVAQAFTFVRGAWLALGLGLAYLAIRRYRVLMLAAPLALVALLFLPGTFSTSALASGSFAERRVGWVDNISKVVSNPFGNGIGLTGASGAKVAQVDKNSFAFVYEPDNQYFKALYELGVVGLWVLLIFFVSILVSLRRAERHLARPRSRARARGHRELHRSDRGSRRVDVARDIAQRDLLMAVPRGRPDGRARIVLNALSLRANGSGVQTYVRELLAALPGAWPDARFVARVARSAAALVPAGVEPVPLALGADHGLARRLRSAMPVRGGSVAHGLDTDPPVAGAPTVVTVHDLALFDVPDAFDPRRGRVKRALVARAIRRSDALVAVSGFTAERVRARFGRDSVVIHEAPGSRFRPPADDAVARVIARHGLPERFVLHLGNLEPRKDLATLAAACRAANVPLLLAGGAINTAGAPGGARVLGYVPDADVPALYAAATVVAYVSRYEGFALPPVEAMACGAVVMATPVGALPDVAGGGIETVPVGDVEAQGRALRELVHDEGRRMERRAAARRAAARLSWERAALETVAVYRSLL